MPSAVRLFAGQASHFTLTNSCVGLAETLRQELLLYSIGVQIYMPVTMYSPGYEEENKTKPELVLKIEKSDPGLTPEQAAEGLYEGATLVTPSFNGKTEFVYAGVQKGEFHITDTFIANLFRASTRGASPFGPNIFKDLALGLIGTVRIAHPMNGCNPDIN